MKVYKNMSGLEFVIIERLEKSRVIVKFLATGSIVKTWSGNCNSGKVSDPFHKSRLGVGYLGNFVKTEYHKQAYQLWSNMLKRCYDPNDKKGYYGKGITVDPHWHCYANFLADLKLLKNFDKWLKKEKYNLDKDLLGDGTAYSKFTCQFLPESENKSYGKLNKKLMDGVWVTTTF